LSKTVVVTGGGTGGHLSVAKSFCDELIKQNHKVIYIGSTKGQDKQWFENYPNLEKAIFLDTKGVVNQNFLGKFKSLFMILKAVFYVSKIYKQYNVSKVISVGGFSAAAGSFAAFTNGIDFYIHEQNSVMGKLNQITSKFAKVVFSSYSEDSPVKDYPINEIFFQNKSVRKEVKTIIFLGGSQGAKAINDFAISSAPKLKEMGISIIHQVGKNDYERVKQEYDNLKLEVDVFDFTTNILEKMNSADFAISRAGASTLWELTALGMPTLYVPFPYAAANHQYYNAKFLADENLAFLSTQDELNEKYLLKCLNSNLKEKSEKLISIISPNGTQSIIDYILK
jgi:UDP-N-acetylglucosamine--N-acetylmuramyl-(pentapeptide) pyrophosphoryl-undecaprenol N-acetylglucosamine transferase